MNYNLLVFLSLWTGLMVEVSTTTWVKPLSLMNLTNSSPNLRIWPERMPDRRTIKVSLFWEVAADVKISAGKVS